MDGVGIVIWIVIGIAFSIFKNASKKSKQQQQQGNKNNAAAPKTTLQSQLNNALKQINDIKTYVSDEVNNTGQPTNRPTFQAQNTRQPYRSSLEGHRMEGYQVEGHQMEGHVVEGHKVEGHKVEGVERKHNTKKFSKERVAVTETSMKQGFAGEGCDEHYDMEIAYTTSNSKREKKNPLYFSDNPIVQGVVMSQVLERGKRR